jgi:ribosomal protein L7Ae-like RNA K-turn-binding protein
MRARDPVLALLGLAARAGAIVPGTARVREGVAADAIRCVILAADASDNAQEKVLPLLERRGVPHAVRSERATLGAAVGKSELSAVGITDRGLAERCMALLGGAAAQETESREPASRRRRS